jgi:hypothetical protein
LFGLQRNKPKKLRNNKKNYGKEAKSSRFSYKSYPCPASSCFFPHPILHPLPFSSTLSLTKNDLQNLHHRDRHGLLVCYDSSGPRWSLHSLRSLPACRWLPCPSWYVYLPPYTHLILRPLPSLFLSRQHAVHPKLQVTSPHRHLSTLAHAHIARLSVPQRLWTFVDPCTHRHHWCGIEIASRVSLTGLNITPFNYRCSWSVH